MTSRNYTIKTMSRAEVDIAVEWAATEGWNPGLHDADCYYTADPNGFFIGYIGDEPIATISVVKYSDAFGFLGFYIVKPEYRGQGYGMQIWNAGLNYLAGCTIGLDGVVAQQDNYKKSGFKLAYGNIRYQGMGGGQTPNNADIVELATVPFAAIDTYVQPFFPAKRSPFIKSWIKQPDCYALGLLDNGNLAGYGVIRPCRTGYKIGPLFADNPQWADALFLALTSKVASSAPVYLDTPDPNREAVALAERHGMQVVFETARMYTGDKPNIPINRLFGVTSFEIG